MRELREDEVTFEIICEPSDIEVRGNAMCTDDEEFNRKVENDILKELNSGNQWAWCDVEVQAVWIAPNGRRFFGADCLCACSYKDEEDFTSNSGYYQDLKDRALNDLNEKLQRFIADAEEIRKALSE